MEVPIVPPAPPAASVAAVAAPSASVKLTAFIKTFVIMDLVFSCLRILLGLLGLAGAGNVASDGPMAVTLPFELASNFGMGVFGILAATLLLGRKPLGVALVLSNRNNDG